ncbi:SDR family oxidoreductase [Sedimentitalea sp. XS_ASV28]|uniref:SDR family oxidoreductase n=1 Tax=Sedimentitalea sp. XS_ASV28 TaxID=3241296 RepID=UPI003517A0C3
MDAQGSACHRGERRCRSRHGAADEVADAILYLLSDAARYVTGSSLEVTSGR